MAACTTADTQPPACLQVGLQAQPEAVCRPQVRGEAHQSKARRQDPAGEGKGGSVNKLAVLIKLFKLGCHVKLSCNDDDHEFMIARVGSVSAVDIPRSWLRCLLLVITIKIMFLKNKNDLLRSEPLIHRED